MEKVFLLGALLASSLAHAGTGVSAAEYQRWTQITQCAYIANSMAPDALSMEIQDKVARVSLATFKADTDKMRPTGYHPDGDDLAMDYATYYQQINADTEDQMFKSIKAQGLPAEPQSWFLVSAQYWLARSCAAITVVQ